MKPIIRIEKLCKQYRIGGLHAGYHTLRETIAGAVLSPYKRLRGNGDSKKQLLWALKDVSFEVRQGETIGLIGQNGAGKSTLLKILSRITEPTSGYFELYGRIGSLLEVGTGFHPDLTGRENVFLSGAIHGMARAEIRRRFDEIVAFSEIEKFIDTPVKWYSTGMYLRLAFAVAAHLDTEILMMDEVLAVGDAGFQQKCLNKMNEIRQQGRTILFVSHSMPAVARLCERVLWIDKGHVVGDGAAHKIVNDYMGASLKIGCEREWLDPLKAPGDDIVRLRRVRVCTQDGRTAETIDIRSPVGLEIEYEILQHGHVLTPSFDLMNESGVHLFAVQDVGAEWRRRPRPAGVYTSTMWIPGNCLSEGNLLVNAAILSHIPATRLHTREYNVMTFQVVDTQEGDSARGDYAGPVPGVIRPLLNWTTQYRVAEEAWQASPEDRVNA